MKGFKQLINTQHFELMFFTIGGWPWRHFSIVREPGLLYINISAIRIRFYFNPKARYGTLHFENDGSVSVKRNITEEQ